ncbi:Serine/threonine-protein phosphatase, partial [Durusdinium trenchii]
YQHTWAASSMRRRALDTPCLEGAPLLADSLAKKLQEALLLAKLEDFAKEGLKALPLSVTNCVVQFHAELQAAFTVVDVATNYDFSNLSSLEVDEPNAQQFVEQLGPGKRPLWAVPVILRPKNAGLVMVFSSVFRESGSVRSHMVKALAVKELKHWTLRNARNLEVTFLSKQGINTAPQEVVLGGVKEALKHFDKPADDRGDAGDAVRAQFRTAQRCEKELLEAEARAAKKEQKAKQAKHNRKACPVIPATQPLSCNGAVPSRELGEYEESKGSDLEADGANSLLEASQPSIFQLLSGWLGSVRAEESCHRVVNANLWHYRRNENACWRLSYLHRSGAFTDRHNSMHIHCQHCADRCGICSCVPNPWRPLPDLEPDGKEPQLLLTAGGLAEPPGLEPELSDISLWRHLLRGTHGFSLHGPEPVSLFPEAPELARTARMRQRNAGWRRWWLSWRKTQGQETEMSLGEEACGYSWVGSPAAPTPMVFMPVPVHLCWKVQQYIEQLQHEHEGHHAHGALLCDRLTL